MMTISDSNFNDVIFNYFVYYHHYLSSPQSLTTTNSSLSLIILAIFHTFLSTIFVPLLSTHYLLLPSTYFPNPYIASYTITITCPLLWLNATFIPHSHSIISFVNMIGFFSIFIKILPSPFSCDACRIQWIKVFDCVALGRLFLIVCWLKCPSLWRRWRFIRLFTIIIKKICTRYERVCC